jgi:hypothetical protein
MDNNDTRVLEGEDEAGRRYSLAIAPKRRRFPILIVIVLLVVTVAAAAFVSAPWFAFRALRSAAQYGDVAAVEELVDFNALRSAFSLQIGEQKTPVTAEPPSIWRDPLGAMRRALGPIAPPRREPAVDRYLSIEGLAALTRGYAPGAAPTSDAQPMAVFRYWDVNRARLAVKRPGAPDKATIFTFERRDWFVWKLVQISLPAGETDLR